MRACSIPGCPAITYGSYCKKHQAEKELKQKHEEKEYNQARGSSHKRGYGHQWQKIRQIKLNSNPLCERCEQDVPAVLVHHRDRDSYNNIDYNLESLCNDCHEQEHKSERFRG